MFFSVLVDNYVVRTGTPGPTETYDGLWLGI